MEHQGYNGNLIGNENNYQTYQNKELEEELGLNWHDFGARRFQSDIARWTTLDPLAEKFYSWSPYTGMNDNPVMFVDPTGMESEEIEVEFETSDDWVYNKKTGKYDWDNNVTSPTDSDLDTEKYEYVGPSTSDVTAHYEENNPISGLLNKKPELGNISGWPGEVMAHENTVFEDVRDFGVENNIPGSETAYNILDDVSVFVTSFDLNPKGQPLHLDGSVSIRGSSEHIESGINGMMTVMPMPKFNIRGFNMAQSNKFFKGTWYNKLSADLKGKALKTFNFLIKMSLTPKKILKQTKSNVERIKN